MADYEDDIIDLFTAKTKNIEYELCYQLAGNTDKHIINNR